MHNRYGSSGLAVMAFPCNQFFNLESGCEAEIKQYVKKRYNAGFPMFAKVKVNGPDAHPLFKYLRRNSALYDEASGTCRQIPWNFGKFLVNSEGEVIKFYGPHDEPLKAERDIKRLLMD